MIIFLRIYKNYANLWVIHNVLTIKMFFATNRVVHILRETGQNKKTKKIEILWPKIYWV